MSWVQLRLGLDAHLAQNRTQRLSKSPGGLLRLPHINNTKAAGSVSSGMNQQAFDGPVRTARGFAAFVTWSAGRPHHTQDEQNRHIPYVIARPQGSVISAAMSRFPGQAAAR